jgi:hypothetical protein
VPTRGRGGRDDPAETVVATSGDLAWWTLDALGYAMTPHAQWDALMALWEKASGGTWIHHPNMQHDPVDAEWWGEVEGVDVEKDRNLAFIVAAHNALPALAAESRRMREALDLAAFLTADEPECDYGSGPECTYCDSKTATPDGEHFVHRPSCEWQQFRDALRGAKGEP